MPDFKNKNQAFSNTETYGILIKIILH